MRWSKRSQREILLDKNKSRMIPKKQRFWTNDHMKTHPTPDNKNPIRLNHRCKWVYTRRYRTESITSFRVFLSFHHVINDSGVSLPYWNFLFLGTEFCSRIWNRVEHENILIHCCRLKLSYWTNPRFTEINGLVNLNRLGILLHLSRENK